MVIAGNAFDTNYMSRLAFAVISLVGIAGAVWLGIIRSRISTRVRECDGAVCVGCGHDVRGLPESGVCPECGKVVDLEECRREWKKAIGE
jgi:predicted RNA-binding Zn-ribbon protein involved in translation (DUF1610 family)